jgi:M6 family metalloprotease-like protein
LAAAAVVLTACSDSVPPTVPRMTRESGLTPSLVGTLQVVWGDPRDPSRQTGRVEAWVSDHTGRMTQVSMGDGSERSMAQLIALNGQRVSVVGGFDTSEPTRSVFHATSVLRETSAFASSQLGNKKYLAILCQFPDYAINFGQTRTKTVYQQWMGVGDVTPTYPSISDFWREESFDQMNFDNSTVVGWYAMPHNRVYYLGTHGTGDTTHANLGDLVTDCTAAADADVNFNDYTGIVVQFNNDLDCCSWGGSWQLNLDGTNKYWPTAWMASWAHQSVYAHESGHSLGLPHSSGPYGQVYDSDWDVMSNTYQASAYNSGLGTYVGQGTISHHKELLGWIADAQKAVVTLNSTRTVFLDRLTDPAAKTLIMAKVPISDTHWYTIETRKKVGYDAVIPNDAVIINDVQTGRSEPAHIVDATMNNDPNDDGAQWEAGESYNDATNGVTVMVNAAVGNGYGVTITNGNPANTWNGEAPLPSAREKAVAASVGTELFVFGGANNTGSLNKLDIYDTKTDLWRRGHAMPDVRAGASAAAVGSAIYVVGGKDSLGAQTRTLWKYTPASNTFAAKAQLPIAGGCGGAASLSGKLYVFIGCTNNSDHANKLYVYDPIANTWTALANAPNPHSAPVIAAISSKIYVVGGLGNDGNPSALVDAYNPADNTWSAAAPTPVATAGSAGGVFNGKLYVTGGLKTLAALAPGTYVYNAGGNSWTTKAGLKTKRSRVAGAFVGNALYTVGGSNLVPKLLPTHEVYHP